MNDFRSYSAAFHAKNDDILHYGILGMKWGVRRYQNPDGSLTAAGKKRYDKYNEKMQEHLRKSEELYKKDPNGNSWVRERGNAIRTKKKAEKYGTESKEEKDKRLKEMISKMDKRDGLEKANTSNKNFSKGDMEKLHEIRNSFKTDESKDKWQRAFDNDIYDLAFLEYTQNDYDDMNPEEKRMAMLSKYAKYCKNKKKFMQRRIRNEYGF